MLYLTNAAVMPNEGRYTARKVSVCEARSIIESQKEFVSALGHEGAVEVFKKELSVDAELNRHSISLSDGDIIIALKLQNRMQVVRELSIEDMNDINYEFWLIEYCA